MVGWSRMGCVLADSAGIVFFGRAEEALIRVDWEGNVNN